MRLAVCGRALSTAEWFRGGPAAQAAGGYAAVFFGVTGSSDPLLDRVPVGLKATKQGAKGTGVQTPSSAVGLEETIERFTRDYPGLFADPKLAEDELTYKRKAHALFNRHFADGRGVALLGAGNTEDISLALAGLYKETNIPSKYEIMAMCDGLKDGAAAARLLTAVLAFVDRSDAGSFDDLVNAVGGVPPAEGSRVLTWPNVTILPFLADPARFIVLKPEISQLMAARMGRDLMYSSDPRWHTYAAFHEMAVQLLERLAPLGARDFVDVHSFMWVTRDKG